MSDSILADPKGMNKALCRSPQYSECFGILMAECQEKAELPFAYCYKAMAIAHPESKKLKPISMSLKYDPTNFDSGADLGKCGEAVYFQLYKSKLVKNAKCTKLMAEEQQRWSPELLEFAKQVQAALK